MPLRFTYLSWLLLLGASLCTTAAHSQALTPIERSEDDLLLMALVLDGVPLSEDFETYVYPEGLLVPLGELCRLLEIGIEVDPRSGTASGFIIRQDRTFSLDLARGEVIIAGKAASLDTGQVEAHLQDLYVDAELIGEWLPVTLQVNRFGSTIVVEPREPLPLQLRLERDRRSQQLPAYQRLTDRGYPRLKNPYKLFSVPAIDQTLTLGNLETDGDGFQLRSSTYMAGDVLGMSGELWGYFDSASDSRSVEFQLQRTDCDGKLLGPLKAREVALGDVFAPSVPMLTSVSSGRGVVISRFPLYQQQQYDLNTFRGRILPGWDVELYRDGLLIGYDSNPQDGEYEFANVPLYYGLNRFALVFYGPRGETRTEERLFYVGESLTPPGENYYRVAYTHPGYGGSKLQWQHEVGLRRDLSVTDTYLHLDEDGESRDYLGLGLRGFLRGWSVRGDVVKDLSGGMGLQLGAQTRLGDAALNMELRRLDDLQSEVYSDTGDPLRLQALLQADGIHLPRALRLQPASLSATYDRYESGANFTTATLRLSTMAQGLWLSNYLYWQRREYSDISSFSQLNGSLLASRRYDNFTARSELQYDITPHTRLRRVALDVQAPLKRDCQLNLSVSHSLADERETFVGLGVTYQTGSVAVGPAVAYSDAPSRFSAGLDLAASMQREPRTGQWQVRPDAAAGYGSASVRVFLDRDYDGRFSHGDEPLPEVGLVVNGFTPQTTTDAQGIAFLTGLPVDQPTDLSVAQASLHEPLWTPAKPGVRFMARPGNVMQVDFAISALAEVAGTIYVELDGKRRELPGVPVELVDVEGKVVAQDRSAYDGFYVLSKLPPGLYRLRLAPAETGRLDLQPIAREVRISGEGGFVDGQDLVVRRVTDSAVQTAPSTATETP